MSEKALMAKTYIWSCERIAMATLQLARPGQNIEMEEFNKPGREIHRCTYDPCLFYIKKDPKIGWTQEPVDSNCPNPTSTSSEVGGSKAEVKFLKDGSLDPAYRPSKHEAWMSIHTDDCDIVGTSDTILNENFQIIDNK